jgi:post-segregation antitoxin (ccd killing protein)
MALVNADTGELVDTLESCEAVIERGLGTFVEVGNALIAIRDGKLYRADHDTFEAYCSTRWGLSRKRAYDLTGAAEVVAALSPMGDVPLPSNERQARALAPMRDDPSAMAEVMVETKAEGTITAKTIAAKVAAKVEVGIGEGLEKAAAKKADNAAIADLNELAEKAGIDGDEKRQTARTTLGRVERDLLALGTPHQFLVSQTGHLMPRHRTSVLAACRWLTDLLDEWGEA